MSQIIKSMFTKLIDSLRILYHKQKGKKLINKNITIISNDCCGGIIYHDLGLRFLSPTINLYFSEASEFMEFLSDISYYSNSIPTQILKEGVNFPVGRIVKGEKKVDIYFMHYKTFDEAMKKWCERAKRINYQNIFVIWHSPSIPDEDMLKSFEKIKYNKILITRQTTKINAGYVFKLNLYDDKDYYPGKILAYKGKFSLKRYLDDVNYILEMNRS